MRRVSINKKIRNLKLGTGNLYSLTAGTIFLSLSINSFYMEERTQRGRAEDRERIAANQEWEMKYMREKYHVTDEQIRNAIATVGNDRNKVEEYFQRKTDHANQPGNEDRSGKEDLQNVAVNPNPRANENIKDRLSALSEAQKRESQDQIGSEITDGEEG